MSRDVRLANNYFEALFQLRQIEKVTKLLNALAGSPNREVKQFAIERSRARRAVPPAAAGAARRSGGPQRSGGQLRQATPQGSRSPRDESLARTSDAGNVVRSQRPCAGSRQRSGILGSSIGGS